ncbi:hypothetical protein F503_00228 [Ophiostoma piceae UAMH 11346]|uniref:Uncharacterized protein n=1 Tax=Ophiostoma piceae (strain UAMH 11346) TaxID=1262450 RepID=S3C6J2_OPHP1|nr:hypothetical protein F503_00228 [Ophiostoma piceae UAMH 11346]
MSYSIPNIERDDCFGLSWNGLMPSGAGTEVRRVRLEQLGLILTPNAFKPTELVEKVLLASKDVRDAFFTFMTMAGCYSLTDMYVNLQSVLPPLPEEGDDVEDTFPYLYKASFGRPLIDPHSDCEDERLTQTWDYFNYPTIENSPPLDDIEKNKLFVSGGMARSLDDVRADDVWGNFYYIPSALKDDVSNIVLQVLLLDWMTVATTDIPHTLKQMQHELTQYMPYSYNPFIDIFFRLRGRVEPNAPEHGGYDPVTFATLLHIQKDPSSLTTHHLPADVYHNELTRMWASTEMRSSIGRVIAAIWEETSRDLSEHGTGCDVSGVIMSLCYALTTESSFIMGNPAIRNGDEDEFGLTQRDYGQDRPVMPDDVFGTSWRIIDAVRIALRRGYDSVSDASYLVRHYVDELPSQKHKYAVYQGALWHAILDWFAIERLPTPPLPPNHLDIIPERAPVAEQGQIEEDGMATETAMLQEDSIAEDDVEHVDAIGDFASLVDAADQCDEIESANAFANTNAISNENEENTMPVLPFGILGVRQRRGSITNTHVAADAGDDDATPPSTPVNLSWIDEDMLSMEGSVEEEEEEEEEEDRQVVYIARPFSQFQMSEYFATINYTTRPHQPNLNLTGWNEDIAFDLVRNREANIHGVGPYLYVAASGEHDHIVLPPYLVDSRRISGNADGVMTRHLVVETMQSEDSAANMNRSSMDTDDDHDHDNITRALRAAFPFAPPLLEPFLPCASLKKQALLAVLRSMQLQLAHTSIQLPTKEVLQYLDTIIGDSMSDVSNYALMNAVASYGATLNIDLRLGIVTDNRVPQIDSTNNNSHNPTAETHFVWVYHSYTRRFNGQTAWDESFQALKPVDSIVGHGRESHFWLGVRQEAFRTWRI